MSQVVKYFTVGEYVKVDEGRHAGVSGLVLKVNQSNHSVTIYCEATKKVQTNACTVIL